MSSTTVTCKCGASVQFTEAERQNRDIRCASCGCVIAQRKPQTEQQTSGRQTLLD